MVAVPVFTPPFTKLPLASGDETEGKKHGKEAK